MRKILLLLLGFMLTSVSATSGRKNIPTTFNQSINNLRHEADSLNTTIKKYNEKN